MDATHGCDYAEVQHLMSRYGRGVDRQDWSLVRGCFHPDAWLVYSTFRGNLDAFMPWVAQAVDDAHLTMHFMGNVVAVFRGQEARSETYCISRRRSGAGGVLQDHVSGFRYLDQLEHRNGAWRILFRMTIVDWTRVEEVAETTAHPTIGIRGPSDVSYDVLNFNHTLAAGNLIATIDTKGLQHKS